MGEKSRSGAAGTGNVGKPRCSRPVAGPAGKDSGQQAESGGGPPLSLPATIVASG